MLRPLLVSLAAVGLALCVPRPGFAKAVLATVVPSESGSSAPAGEPITGGPAGSRAGAAAKDRRQSVEALRQKLDELLQDKPLAQTHIGVVVVDARDGEVLFEHNADRPFNPASNTKILATAAALSRLGVDYRYATRLHGPLPDDDGVIHGSVELRGSGDPSLGTIGLADLARGVAERGITRIDGDLLADGRFRDAREPRATFGGGALIFNKNTFTIHVRPTQNKKPASVSLDPGSPDFVSLVNKVTTVRRGKSRIKVAMDRRDGRYVATVKGRVNLRAEERIKQHIDDSAWLTATLLKRALADFGVKVKGSVKSGGVAGDAPALAEHRSAPLADICRIANKDSNNFVADTIFKTLGREVYGAPASLDKGIRAVDEEMPKLGLAAGSYKIVNGSGLTHENRIAPAALAQLLRNLLTDLSVAPEFVSSLAVGGIDGTIKSRFRGDDVGRVRAKTGTLSNVSALSGYVGLQGEVLVFSILVDDFNNRKLEEVRYAQNRMVREMLAWMRADKLRRAGQSGAAAPPVDEVLPTDSSDDGEPVDDETEESDDPGGG